MDLYKKLESATEISDVDECNKLLNEGMTSIVMRNKLLVLSDKHGWKCAATYTKNPIADDTDDEKKIKKVLKESKQIKEERQKIKRLNRKVTKRPFASQGHSLSQIPVVQSSNSSFSVCFRCRRPGHFARQCRAGIPTSGFSGGTTGFPGASRL